MLTFAYCVSWGFAFIDSRSQLRDGPGDLVPGDLPPDFASAIFVQVSSMPGWLRPFANNQPVSQVTEAVRGLMLVHRR